MKKTKAKTRLTQALSLSMLGGVMSPYAVMANEAKDDVVDEVLINNHQDEEDVIAEFSNEISVDVEEGKDGDEDNKTGNSEDLTTPDNETSDEEISIKYTDDINSTQYVDEKKDEKVVNEEVNNGDNKDNKPQEGKSEKEDKEEDGEEENKGKDGEIIKETLEDVDSPNFEIKENIDLKLKVENGTKIDTEKLFDGEAILVSIDGYDEELDILDYFRNDKLKTELEAKGIKITRTIYDGDKKVEGEITVDKKIKYTVKYEITSSNGKEDLDKKKNLEKVVEILRSLAIKTTSKVTVKDGSYYVNRSDLPKDIKELKGTDLFTEILVDEENVDLNDLIITFDKSNKSKFVVSHADLEKDLDFIINENVYEAVLKTKDSIELNINEDITDKVLKSVIEEATINGKDFTDKVHVTSDLPTDKKDLNKNKEYTITATLKHTVDGKEVVSEKASTKVRLVDHGVVLRVESRVDWEFGKKITQRDLEGFIREAKIDGKSAIKDVVIDHDININRDGRYDITYTLKDDKGNKVVETTRVYVENDIDFSVPSKITLEKSDRRYTPSTDDVIARKGERSYINKLKITHNVIPNKVGTYHINYTLEIGEYKETKSTRVEVVEGPEFIVPEQIVVKKGERFIPTTEGVIAKISGKDHTKDIKFEHNVNVHKVGEYELKYILKNKGETYERKSTVLVVDGVTLDVHKTGAIEYGGNFDPMSFINKAMIGDVDAIDKVTASHEVDTNKPGKYEVVYSMDLGNGKTFEQTMELTVLKEGEIILDDSNGSVKPDGDNYEDEEEYEWEYEEETINEVVKTGEAASGYEALRAAFMSAPILGVTLGGHRSKKKNKK